ncbi:MAG: tRNA (adenosine(37)-N6)-threonylcarbamoyltransferase complex dimerization subunit type 1 TsaB [Gammaproteobacteria bacterium]|jgi:tRNA threonylcarbamoyladenosine biosynthesis protein TsaB|nr:tRNA (adenosine(37)-N6)-threonylcarbamoyltransferase complex dimerization subunit type 1 TsaB [Zhongshania sp.]MBU0537633.1 tRNA (adenosine(37)-N6)-threonylcarbamoyltransferase complex dimerization subunit type 1 TsaB [Gammaproteobacteria bacterium]MBU1831501.1 tRNA (adenosine(37)-N6)-threonylcarbamoyltransferase complex dimerization subunit type 1 TsaB [Gammaproteobacteria bacterium]
MTSLLAIEASTEACSVALLHKGQQREDFRLLPRAHTRYLLPMVDQILSEEGIRLSDLDAIGFSAGPGSFTGLRVCAGVVQGLAFAADKPVVAVSTLQAMAQGEADQLQLKNGDVLLPALDARMDEVYWGEYRYFNGFAEHTAEDSLRSPESISVAADEQRVFGFGSGWIYAPRFSLGMPLNTMNTEVYPRAQAVLKLAVRAYERGDYISAEQAQPVYLRDSVAWQKS